MLVSCTARIVPTADSESGSRIRRAFASGPRAGAPGGRLPATSTGTLGENLPASQSKSTTTPAEKATKTTARPASRDHRVKASA